MQTREIFRNPPVSEAILRIQVQMRPGFSVAEFESVHDVLRDEYPTKEQQLSFQGAITLGAEGSHVSASTGRVTGFAFISEDKQAMYAVPAQYTSVDAVVLSFLSTHPYLLRILEESLFAIRACFGDACSVHLSVEGTEVENQMLIVWIRPAEEDIDQAFERLKALDETWWVDAYLYTDHKMNIDLEL